MSIARTFPFGPTFSARLKAGIPPPEAISSIVAPGKRSKCSSKISAKGVDHGSFFGSGHNKLIIFLTALGEMLCHDQSACLFRRVHDMAEDGQGQWVARLENWFEGIRYDLPDPVADASIRWKTEV